MAIRVRDMSEGQLLARLAQPDVTDRDRWNIANELTDKATDRSVDTLREMTKSGWQRVRLASVDALGHVGTEAAIDALIDALGSENQWVVGFSARQLERQHANRALPDLLFCAEIRASELSEAGVRCQLVRAIGSMRDPGAVEVLRRYAVDPVGDVRDYAVTGLREIDTAESRAALEWAAANPPPSRLARLLRARNSGRPS